MNTIGYFRFLFTYTILYTITNGFHLYDTDRFDEISIDQIQYDCIHYYVRNFLIEYTYSDQIVHQTIAYCIRPLSSVDDFNSTMVEENGNIVTFNDLQFLGVTSQQLYSQWFAPVDVAERYELFLKNIPISEPYFINCSSQYFGSRCQYQFVYISNISTFSDLVEDIFFSKQGITGSSSYDNLLFTNLTCYAYLNCDRGPPPSCLDWREVCDGKIDCMNGGVDEKECFELESHNCLDYRCHIGHCVPDEFVYDDALNPDCLDGSDEPASPDYTKSCISDPAFRCEERKSRRFLQRTCGDGSYDDMRIGNMYSDRCLNQRYTLLTRALLFERPASISESCWFDVLCFHPLPISYNSEHSKNICKNFSRWNSTLMQTCPTLFFYPIRPILFGHVQFAYRKSAFDDFEPVFIPSYICYDETLCDHFTWKTYNITGQTCVLTNVITTKREWDGFLYLIYDTFRSCTGYSSRIPRKTTHCEDDNLYLCEKTSKCISKHRLNDGFRDCPNNDDESNVNISCFLPDAKYRYRCKEPNNKCISLIQLQDFVINCESGDDETNPMITSIANQPPFSKLCDGITDIEPIQIFNESESDETHCEQWPCDDIYTRCDDFWTCRNGIDESRCINPLCDFHTHPCLSPFDNQLICLPIDKANNGEVDCRGGTDERYFCRDNQDPLARWPKYYRCLNETTCIDPLQICLTINMNNPMCKFSDDQQFCSTYYEYPDGFCNLHMKPNDKPTVEQLILCNLVGLHEVLRERPDVYLLLDQSKNYPMLLGNNEATEMINKSTSTTFTTPMQINLVDIPSIVPGKVAWICNRGIPLQMSNETRCLCPPSYYGSRCEYQNQRVSLTLRFRKEVGFDQHSIFTIVVTLIDMEEHQIESFDQILYLPSKDCSAKFNIYLLYSRRPKIKMGTAKKYGVRIDAYNKHDLTYHATWFLEIPSQFLPVNRISTYLTMPVKKTETFLAPSHCIHGRQVDSKNTNKMILCVCDSDWSGRRCDIQQACDCSTDSRCVGAMANNRSICVCPLQKFGRRCLLTHASCSPEICQHGGICIPSDERISETNFTCLCTDNYFGMHCEYLKGTVEIRFTDGLAIPTAIIAHVISVPDKSVAPIRVTLFKRSKADEDYITLSTPFTYHMIFVEINSIYYLAVLQERGISSTIIKTFIKPSRRCLHIKELFNSTLISYPILRRVKYYHSVCEKDLACFYDEVYMCLCTIERHTNCFHFDHSKTSVCRTVDKYCEHDKAQCFEDHPICPNSLLCVCPKCTFGTKCQFSATGFGFSLDAIIGYHIRSGIIFTRQTRAVKISAALTIIIFPLGLINGVLSILTFKSPVIQKVGSGIYLLSSSVVSILIMITFLLKFWFLVWSQMTFLTDHLFLIFNCKTMDFLLKTLLSTGDWLNACVAIERALTVSKGVLFDKTQSKRTARWMIIFIFFMTTATNVPDPIYRRLVDDGEEKQRIWCVVSYPKQLESFMMTMSIFHFLAPFAINLGSALFIITQMARQRSAMKKNQTYWGQFKEELDQSKNLLISPCILVVLALPRLIISFVAGCMQSARNPWVFLVGYYISFMPPLTTLLVFVLPSTTYKEEFDKAVLKHINALLQRIRRRQ